MDGFSILAGLTAANNRATEAFKMLMRDNTFPVVGQIREEWRRLFTLLFSVLFGIGSFFVLGSSVSFDGTWLAPFADNPISLNILGGFSVSVVSGAIQPLMDRLAERGGTTIIELMPSEEETTEA